MTPIPLTPGVGTPALTTRGFDESTIKKVAHRIVDLIDKPDDDALAAEVDSEMDTLAEEHPIYEEQ